jgi:hypothetical protein
LFAKQRPLLPPDSLHSTRLNGKYLIQYRSPIPRLQSNYDLAVTRGTVEQSKESLTAFAECETVYFINFYRKWIAVPRPNALAVAYEDLIERQERTLVAVASFIIADSGVDQAALARALAQATVGGVRDPMLQLFTIRRCSCGSSAKWRKPGGDRIRFHFI